MQLNIKIVKKHASASNSAKLLKILQYPISFLYINIDLSSYIEGFEMIAEFTYGSKSNFQLVFYFGKKINDLIVFYPSQDLCELLPSDLII
jgi:hypothetical protein